MSDLLRRVLEWAVVSVRSGRDVDELPRLSECHAMPDSLRDDEGVACTQLDRAVTFRELEANADRARDHVKEFVAIGVDLTVVRRVAGELGALQP